jgi:hypothetical protein
VDSGTLKVYQYVGAASRTSGSQLASATFALAAHNTNPQGIADPPPADLLLAGTPALPASDPLPVATQNELFVGRPASFANVHFEPHGSVLLVMVSEQPLPDIDPQGNLPAPARNADERPASSLPASIPEASFGPVVTDLGIDFLADATAQPQRRRMLASSSGQTARLVREGNHHGRDDANNRPASLPGLLIEVAPIFQGIRRSRHGSKAVSAVGDVYKNTV